MENLKKMALGLLVAVLAVGFSAFTSKSASKSLLTYRYANTGTEYVQIAITASPENCLSGSDEQCLIESDQNLPSFGHDEKPNDWQPVPDSDLGIYNP